VDPDDRSVRNPHELDESRSSEDLGFAVAAEVVLVGLDLRVLLAGLRFGEAHGRDLGLAVGHSGDRGFDDGGR